ncbi:MAG TPA: alpha/beta hydrolase [Ktedonobacteraceae bacterium]|nr:alpha/beta hydrolase [Ktedonobacteraceae bacterium]
MSEYMQTGFAEINGTKLYYEVAGAGHPLVLNHGGLVDHHLWDEQVEEFARHFKVIRYDIRGFGQSGLIKKGMEPFSLEGDLYGLLRFLGVEKTYVLGLSMGGALSINFTLQYPEMVDALITVGAGLSGFNWDEIDDEEFKAKDRASDEAFKNGDIAHAVELSLQLWTDGPNRAPEHVDSQVRERVRAMTTRNLERGDDEDVEPLEMDPPAAGRLSEIHVPTLVIVGGQDGRPIHIIADTLAKGIAGARKVIIPGTAHHLNMELPEEFNQVVIEFLEQI